MFIADDVVIWSADLSLDELVPRLQEGLPVKHVKIDRAATHEEMSLNILGFGKSCGYNVFGDAKISEVPSKVARLARQHLEQRPWMLNVMAGVWSNGRFDGSFRSDEYDALKQFAVLCDEAGTLSCAVTVLTSTSEEVARAQYGRSALDQVLLYVEQLIAAGFDAAVCSPLEVSAIRRRFGNSIKLVVPGVRLPGGNMHDQKRVDTPFNALKDGADWVVIGRELTNGNFKENYERVSAHLRGEEI